MRPSVIGANRLVVLCGMSLRSNFSVDIAQSVEFNCHRGSDKAAHGASGSERQSSAAGDPIASVNAIRRSSHAWSIAGYSRYAIAVGVSTCRFPDYADSKFKSVDAG